MIRFVLSALALLGFLSPPVSVPAQACAAADRLRRFPLGSVGSEIVLAELKERRGHLQSNRRGPGPPLARPNLLWRGRIWLRRASAAGQLKKRGKSIGTYRAMVSTYYRDIRRPLQRALKQAKKIRGFRAFAKPKLYLCFNRSRCGPFRLRAKGKKLYLSTTQGKRQLDIRWLQKTLKGNFHHPCYTPAYTLKHSAFAYVVQYKWGRRAVLSLNVSPALDKKYFGSVGFKPSSCRSVVSCAAPAGLSDHVAGMDVVTVVPWSWVKVKKRKSSRARKPMRSPKKHPRKR